MIYLIPDGSQPEHEGPFTKPLTVSNPILALADAMASRADVVLAIPPHKLSEWMPLFRLTTPTPTVVLNVPKAPATAALWRTAGAELPLTEYEELVFGMRREREQRFAKDAPPEAKLRLAREQGARVAAPGEGIDVVDITESDEVD